MIRAGWKSHAAYMFFLCIALATAVLSACDDSSSADADEPTASLQSSSSSKAKSSSSKELYPDTFKPNDKEYPYANIPRIVIYTENQQKIKDRETEIPAKLQIWGKKKAESEILDLTIRGRGNSSWGMPKKSYKIEFAKKQSMLGMPKDKDWALIANYADKTLMRNFIAYRLSAALGAYYAPRCEFAELYLNGEYLGVYLLTETIKISENRVNIPKNDYSYIVEVDGRYNKNEQVVFSDVITENGTGIAFRVHDPKNATDNVLDTVQDHIQNFENFFKTIQVGKDNSVDEWIDVDESIKHYWVQELSKNTDARFYTSVYFSWVKGEIIKMGPVWDFDLAFGNHGTEKNNAIEDWFLRVLWYEYLFQDSVYREYAKKMWNEKSHLFASVLDTIDYVSVKLKKSTQNNFKRWNVLGISEGCLHQSFDSYEDAVDDLKIWISKRIQWIDSQY
ncbi:CotH kinase family protein [Fibrobacter sp. UWB13]|uniref:CotH kinase family protein n=1 Tax=Fibrobacter sp. UWB13 TaxID=1896204 RepID=UPI000A0E8CA9|nr:CotH kinase family protein [Fibrobacter sp. UWB13]SMG24597.1 CotH protein [Fibrobacter sp. UWB13]